MSNHHLKFPLIPFWMCERIGIFHSMHACIYACPTAERVHRSCVHTFARVRRIHLHYQSRTKCADTPSNTTTTNTTTPPPPHTSTRTMKSTAYSRNCVSFRHPNSIHLIWSCVGAIRSTRREHCADVPLPSLATSLCTKTQHHHSALSRRRIRERACKNPFQ